MSDQLKNAANAVHNKDHEGKPDYLAARELEQFLLDNLIQDRDRVLQLMRQNPDVRCLGSKGYNFQQPGLRELDGDNGWSVDLSLNPSLIPVSKEFHPDAEVDNVFVRDIAVDVRKAVAELAKKHGVDFEVNLFAHGGSATFSNVLPPQITEYADRAPRLNEMPGVELTEEGFVKVPETMAGRGYAGTVWTTFRQPK